MTDNNEMDVGKGPPIGGQPGSGYSSRPGPDPTTLTTQALYREVASLRELVEQRIAALDNKVQVMCDALTNEVHIAIANRDQLDDVKSDKVQQQFTLMEQQRREQKSDTQAAVQAALTAQKEAITKSEASTTKQIDQMASSFAAAIDARVKATNDNKERIIELERTMRRDISLVDTKVNAVSQQKAGAREDRAGLYAALGALGVLVAIILAVVGVIVTNQ